MAVLEIGKLCLVDGGDGGGDGNSGHGGREGARPGGRICMALSGLVGVGIMLDRGWFGATMKVVPGCWIGDKE